MTQPAASDGDLLTLQEAADRLKVHYMTAYRWVRRGDLPAFKAGGRLRVRVAELEGFLAQRQVDVASPTATRRRTDWESHVDRLHRHLLAGQAPEVTALLRRVVADGAPAGDVYLSLLAPALHRIGDDWEQGRISIAIEHRATSIAVAAMARLADLFRRRGATRGTAVTLTPPHEQHGVGAAMTADLLRASGYDVHHLGCDVPLDALETFLDTVPCDVVCASITTPGLRPGYYERLVAAATTDRGRPIVVVGGRSAEPEATVAAGAVHLDDLRELVPRLEVLRAAA